MSDRTFEDVVDTHLPQQQSQPQSQPPPAIWHSLVQQQYHFEPQRRRPAQPRGEMLLARVDEVPAGIIGSVIMKHLLDYAPGFGKQILRMLHDGDVEAAPEAVGTEERARRRAKRGEPPDGPVHGRYFELIGKLEDTGMVENVRRQIDFDKPLGRGRPEPQRASFFLVDKPNKFITIEGEKWTMLRIIIDARRANAACGGTTAFEMFQLDSLLQTISNVSHAATASAEKSGEPAEWYAVDADFRHWFHQFLLPTHLRDLFVLDCSHGDGDKHVRKFFRLRSLPMGWSHSPRLAQAAAWTLILGGKHPPSSVAQMYRDLPEMPGWVPFANAEGGIFVTLDNILIISNDKSLVEEWRRYVIARAKLIGAQWKPEVRGGATYPEPTLITLRQGGATTFQFGGLEVSFDSWKTIAKERSIALDKTEPYTHRDVAGLLGEVGWDLRVKGKTPLATKGIRPIYSLNVPESHSGWDEDVTFCDDDARAAFRKLLEYAGHARRHDSTDIWPAWHFTTSLHYATDACLEEDGRSQQALVRLDGTDRDPVEIEWRMEAKAFTYIGEGELYAILMAVLDAKKRDPHVSLIVVASDSLCAKGWIERMYADRYLAFGLLVRLHEALRIDGTHSRLYVTYVRSANNVADAPSRALLVRQSFQRGGLIEAGPLHATRAVIRSAYAYATTKGAQRARARRRYARTASRSD